MGHKQSKDKTQVTQQTGIQPHHIEALNQTTVDQHEIQQVIQNARTMNVFNPFIGIISTQQNEDMLKETIQNANNAYIHCITHSDIRNSIQCITRELFDEKKHDAVILILITIISVQQHNKTRTIKFVYDQNGSGKHIKELEKDLKYRIPEDKAIVLHYAKSTIAMVDDDKSTPTYRAMYHAHNINGDFMIIRSKHILDNHEPYLKNMNLPKLQNSSSVAKSVMNISSIENNINMEEGYSYSACSDASEVSGGNDVHHKKDDVEKKEDEDATYGDEDEDQHDNQISSKIVLNGNATIFVPSTGKLEKESADNELPVILEWEKLDVNDTEPNQVHRPMTRNKKRNNLINVEAASTESNDIKAKSSLSSTNHVQLLYPGTIPIWYRNPVHGHVNDYANNINNIWSLMGQQSLGINMNLNIINAHPSFYKLPPYTVENSPQSVYNYNNGVPYIIQLNIPRETSIDINKMEQQNTKTKTPQHHRIRRIYSYGQTEYSLFISKAFIDNVPSCIRQNLCPETASNGTLRTFNLNVFIKKRILMQCDVCDDKGNTLQGIDFGFVRRSINKQHQPLYGVIYIERTPEQNRWRLKDSLYTALEMKEQFGIDTLPTSPINTKQIQDVYSDINALENILYSDINALKNTIKKCPWHKQHCIPILKKYNNKCNVGLLLWMNKDEFVRKVNGFLDSVGYIELMPLIMFDKDNRYYIHYLWSVYIYEYVWIGLSFEIRDDCLDITGIHLNKQYMKLQHQLIDPYHHCKCFDTFASNINDLKIICHDHFWYQKQYEGLKKENKTLKKENEKLRLSTS